MDTGGAHGEGANSSALPGYLPIAEHGIIGDLHTAALVGTDGSIDWYCCPAFDSPSIFGAILDRARGGYYRIAPAAGRWTTKQLYLPDTNVLITRYLTPQGVGEVQDFMPIERVRGRLHHHRLIRRVLGVRGQMRFLLNVQPRFNYGTGRPPDVLPRERRPLPLTRHLARARDLAHARVRRVRSAMRVHA